MKPLDAARLLGAGPFPPVGNNLVLLEETDSTNDEAWRLLAAGRAVAVLAEGQTAGRGRFGRRWECPPRGGVLLSLGLPAGSLPAATELLTAAAAVAAAEAVIDLGLPARIRWPNDVVLGERKVAGILAEVRLRPARGSAGVIGVGINADFPGALLPEELRPAATTLADELGRAVDRTALAADLLRRLGRWLDRAGEPGAEALGRRWRELSPLLGRRLRLVEDGRPLDGTVLDLFPDGRLALRLDGGGTRLIEAARSTLAAPGGG